MQSEQKLQRNILSLNKIDLKEAEITKCKMEKLILRLFGLKMGTNGDHCGPKLGRVFKELSINYCNDKGWFTL